MNTDAIKIYGKFLTAFEKKETLEFETIYYMNVTSKRKILSNG